MKQVENEQSPPPEILVSSLRETLRVIRENLLSQEELLEQVAVTLQQQKSGARATASTAARAAAWSPPGGGAAMISGLPTIKVRKVEPHPRTPNVAHRLRASLIGRFYIEHLKQIPLIRKIVIAIWRNTYPTIASTIAILHSREASRWRPVVKMTDYVNGSDAPKINVIAATKVDTPPPEVVPTKDSIYLESPHNHYEFPPIYIAQLSDAQVYGGTNLVFTQEAVICHDLYDFVRDYTSEELNGRHVFDKKKERIRLVRSDATPGDVPVAAAFLDSCAPNYAHWLTEVLPRIAVFCSLEQHANVPIIVDDGLHPNILQSLALIVGNNREIVFLPVGRAISVGTLYITSVTGYVPFERRNAKIAGHSHGLFSSLAFDLLRKQLLSFCDKHPLQDFPKKIYLRRKSGGRKITNANELEELLRDNGYVIVEPENLTFLQQLDLFSRVDEIVAPSGAALANLIFTRSDARVHILIGRYESTSYWYWQNIACASGKQIIYSLGELSDRQSTIHSDFAINTGVFSYAK